MGVNYFSKEQVEDLRKNPYVVNVTEKAITYSEEFKELFLTDYENGMNPSGIFSKYGFDPKVLGLKRRTNFVQRVKKQSQRLDGFKDTRSVNSGRPSTKELTQEEEIERLKHQVEILKQENDFLKRVRFINRRQISKQSKKGPQEKNSN